MMMKKKRGVSLGLMGAALLALGGLGAGQVKAFEKFKAKMTEHIKK